VLLDRGNDPTDGRCRYAEQTAAWPRHQHGPGHTGQIGHQGALELAVECRLEFQALRNVAPAPRAPGRPGDSHRAKSDPWAAPSAADDDYTGAGFQSGIARGRGHAAHRGVVHLIVTDAQQRHVGRQIACDDRRASFAALRHQRHLVTAGECLGGRDDIWPTPADARHGSMGTDGDGDGARCQRSGELRALLRPLLQDIRCVHD
jgi:hypothetical protein